MRKTSTLLFLALLAGILGAAEPANLVRNPGMESGAGPWVPYGTLPGMGSFAQMIAVSDRDPHSGKFALQVTDTWDRCRPYAVQKIDLPKDARYIKLNGFVRVDRPRNIRFGLLFNGHKDGKEIFIRSVAPEMPAGTAWQAVELPLTAVPDKADSVHVMLAPTSYEMTETGTAWFDDVTLSVYTGDALPLKEQFALDRDPVNQQEYPPTPADGSVVKVNPPSFALLPPRGARPMQYRYTIEYARDAEFKDAERISGLDRCMVIPKKLLAPGKWYWRYGVEAGRRGTIWSRTRSFTVAPDAQNDLWPDLDQAVRRISKKHPRLYISPEMVPEIRRRARSGELKKLVDEMKAWMDAKAIGKPLIPEPPYLPNNVSATERLKVYTHIFRTTRPDQHKMNICALLYLLTGDRKYGEEARRRIKYFFVDWDPEGPTALYNNDEPAMWIMRWGVCAYDWTWDVFTPEERAAIERSIAIRAKQNYDVLRKKPMDSNPYESHANGYLMILGEAAIELLPEHPEMKEYLDYALTIFRTAAPTYGTPDGGWNEGPGYWSYTIDRTLRFVAVVRHALGIDLMKKPFFRNTGYYPMIGWPGRSRQTSFGDGTAARNQAEMLRICAAMTQDPAFLKPAQDLKITKLPMSIWAVFIDRCDLPPAKLEKLPKARLFEGIGFVAMRTDLRDFDNDVGLIFQSNPFGAVSHHHNAQNCFMLEAYGEPLAISSGYYDFYSSSHHGGWTRETKARNGITYDGGKGQIRGGQAAGRITRFETGPDFDIAVGDAVKAYPGFTRAERTVVHVRPGFFVLRDRCEAKTPHVYEYNLHGVRNGTTDEAGQTITVKMPKAELQVRFFAEKPWKFRSFDKFPIAPHKTSAGQQFPEQWHAVASAPEKANSLDLVTVLLPYRTGEGNKLPKVERIADGVRFTFVDGRVRTVRFAGDKILTGKQ